ncbi:MAG TPA: prephenate dehydrogenase/arogenate dehydrogenase family protein [Bacillota bacterium]
MIALIGLGLIGASLGLAWRRAGAADRILGIDPDPWARGVAIALGAVDEATPELHGAAGADVVVLAAPPAAVLALAEPLAEVVKPGAVVTDVCSVKVPVVKRYEAALGCRAGFVGGHPMAGKAASGAYGAEAGLFAGRPWILTPTTTTDPGALAGVEAMARAAGARVQHLSPEDHDRRVARASHLPQVVATSLMLAVDQPDLGRVAGPGLWDTTRLAGSPGALWAEILTLNAEAVLAAAGAFRRALESLLDAVGRGDTAAVRRLIESGAAARRRLEEGS